MPYLRKKVRLTRDKAMRIDMHVHAVGNGRDLARVDDEVYFNADDNHQWFSSILYNMVEGDLEHLGADFNRDGRISTDEYFQLLYRMLLEGSGRPKTLWTRMSASNRPTTFRLRSWKTPRRFCAYKSSPSFLSLFASEGARYRHESTFFVRAFSFWTVPFFLLTSRSFFINLLCFIVILSRRKKGE